MSSGVLFVLFPVARGNMHLCKNMLSPVETFVLQPSDDYRSAASANVMATCGARPSTYRPMSLAPEDFNQDCLDQAFRKFGYHATTGKLLVKNRHGILLATPGISVSEYTPKPYRRRGENAIRQVQAVNHEQHRVVCICKFVTMNLQKLAFGASHDVGSITILSSRCDFSHVTADVFKHLATQSSFVCKALEAPRADCRRFPVGHAAVFVYHPFLLEQQFS